MREIRSYGSVGERGGNEPLYPENLWGIINMEGTHFQPFSWSDSTMLAIRLKVQSNGNQDGWISFDNIVVWSIT